MINQKITNKMLNEINIKNLLYNKYIETLTKEMFQICKNKKELAIDKETLCFLEERIRYNEIMLNSIDKDLNLEKTENFEIIYQTTLDYTVPIAFQDIIKIEFDFRNTQINNLHSLDLNYKYTFLNLCIFPYKSQSLILLFSNKKDNNLENFIYDFNSLKEEEKHNFLIYFIFKYNDTFLLNKKMPHQTYFNNKIMEFVNDNGARTNDEHILRAIGFNPELIKNNLNNVPKMPAILSKKYIIKKED